MFNPRVWRALFIPILSCTVTAQVLTIPGSTNPFTSTVSLDAIQTSVLDTNIFLIERD